MNKLVWIDLDGVMVDLHRGLKEQFNFEFPTERSPEAKTKIHSMWDNIHQNHPSFWVDLEPTPYYIELYSAILRVCPHPMILSATPEHYVGDQHQNCETQKKNWVIKNLGLTQGMHTVITKSKLKQDVIPHYKSFVNILVDDHPGNIERWSAAGGIAIHHTDIRKTLSRLKELE